MRRRTGILLRVLFLLAVSPLALLMAINLFLDVGLPLIVNRRPERLTLRYDVAWMLTPGVIEVRNFEMRQQGMRSQMLLKVDRASVEFDLMAMLNHTIHISTADGHGATFWWRSRRDAVRRMDPETSGENADVGPVQEDEPGEEMTAPIPGLTNPPDPVPETLYSSKKPWRVELDDLSVDGIRELWINDYRYQGGASVSGNLKVESRKWLEVEDVKVSLEGGELFHGDTPMLRALQGEATFDLVGTNAYILVGTSLLGLVSGTVEVAADVANLSFMNFYLQAAPWLRLRGGVGKMEVALAFEDGAFMEGSQIVANVDDIVVRFLDYSAIGDGEVEFKVGDAGGVPQSAINVAFLDYAIVQDGDETPHVKGQGLSVRAISPDVTLDRPFTSIEVLLDLPEAEIPDIAVYNVYLPHDIGLNLRSGSGTIRGFLRASSEESLCDGELFMEVKDLRATLERLTLGGNLSLHAAVPTGNLATGEYDISGSSLGLGRIRLISGGSDRKGKDDSTGWWASIKMPKGTITTQAPVVLDGSLVGRFRDTTPFITIFSEKKHLPGWLRGVLGVGPVSGRARVRLGRDVVRVSGLHMFAGKYEVLMDLRKRKSLSGKLYVRRGILSAGVGMSNGERKIHIFRSRKWYDAEPVPY